MTSSEEILKKHWGYHSFRPLQQQIIESVLTKKDTLALMPTGGGKSVCFQVPAMAQDGICLVVSPLIALMKDQVENLKKKGIFALAIYSGMSRRLIVQTLKNAAFGEYKFLYVSPERIETALFQEFLPALNINLIAVDEAHCISQWGYDFRPAYLRIAELRIELPGVPVLALTASATEEVQKDICEKLSLSTTNKNDWKIFRQSFERKNLSYSVFKVDSKVAKLVQILSKVEGTAIVYCKSRKRTTEIANLLLMHGISAHAYHAGLQQEERNKKQQEWIDNKVKVMACTNAFGMGIDKPDVRIVVHVDAPDSLENYYQEAGRAGRDEKKSYAVLLYDEQDLIDLDELHLKRFPSFKQIQKVYHALVNYLQIPVNSGQDERFTFRFENFIKNFKLQSSVSLYALKALESDGWFDFNEKNYSPSTVVFTASKYLLNEFQQSHPEHEILLTTLLRTYEGIFDFPASISEILLAKLLKTDVPEIKNSLKKIASFGIINYAPQEDEPQIIFRKNRVASEDLTMNISLYNKRKEAFIKRVEKIISYTKTSDCRSEFINNYFGDKRKRKCMICDNCLSQKTSSIGAEEFENIREKIINVLQRNPLSFQNLITNLNGISKEKARRVINFLQAEQNIFIDEKGSINLKN